ncbi:MAG TPA: 3-deoxy-8-phosphooctulonate synthase, partial [Chitinophagaceae bacterium]|nr:3-deoxy-8-phosphooctulonate synthase [Chitinophagaceae bacterium]
MSTFLNELFSGQDFDPAGFFLIAGPCVVESEDLVFDVAGRVSEICRKHRIPLVFKASYKKANRTSASSFTGLGDKKGLEILQKAARHFNLPVTTDIHSEAEARLAAGYVDILQIPAFLCRQTELLVAAGQTGKIVNVKKGQFVSGEAMRFAVEKIRQAGNDNILLTERGTTFGYQDLVVDYRNIPIMKNTGVPVVMDCTHSLQQPNQTSGVTGGNPQLIGTIASAAIAAGT